MAKTIKKRISSAARAKRIQFSSLKRKYFETFNINEWYIETPLSRRAE